MSHAPDGTTWLTLGPLRVRPLRFWGGLFVLMSTARMLSAALAPALLDTAPAALVWLSPFMHNLVAAAGVMSALGFWVSAMGVSLTKCTIGYEFGRAAGEKAHALLEKNGIPLRKLEWAERWMRRASPLVLLASPGAVTCAIAAAAGIRRRVFYPMMAFAQFVWVFGCYAFGTALQGHIRALTDGLSAHAMTLSLTALLLIALYKTGVWQWRRRRALVTVDGKTMVLEEELDDVA